MMRAWLHIISLVLLSVCSGCESDSQFDRLSEIEVVKLGEAYAGVGAGYETVFTGNDIQWFDEKTRELRLDDNFLSNRLPSGGTLLFKLADMELFTVHVISGLTAGTCNDLVLFYDVVVGKYYLYDSYPKNTSSEIVRLNAEIRSENWALFLMQLRREGRIKE